MSKIVMHIPDETYKWVKNHEEGITDYQTTQILYNRVRHSESIEEYVGEIQAVIFEATKHLEDKEGIVKIVLDILDKYKEGDEG